ncbi:cell division protein FtsA [Desulfotomaculum nigrificans CO-1-SRB]|uniref:Cell division protein FtsA n=1 Tax=Desulfotomaculum nigrificans (strain DSM 14880 / VKM B-2319 / CO-1-SRB) TaxID=868595 RepID=F6B3D8_DESCC|nr:cell division FtsA domain-containing protein [Desulfotomaculum nigrificans]AEF95169.1 cell division protein FtsA [Desulfotomaculum nigrificans CO-1-SRB]
MARRQVVVAGLDIGTTKVVAVIAEIGPNGYPMIKGIGECPTVGVRKGTVSDVEALSKSINNAVKSAQDLAGETIQSVWVAFPVANSLTGTLEFFDGQLVNSVRLAGLNIVEMVPSVVASAEAVLTDTDKNLGTVLMDMGGTTTGLAVFDRGQLVWSHYLPVGSEHITTDLAVCLRTTIGEAERVKQSLGLQYPEQNKILQVPGVNGQGIKKVPGVTAVEIIQSRVQEILELAQQELSRFDRSASLPGGLIITGGGALLTGLLEFTGNALAMQVKLGSTARVGVPREEWTGPAYASAIGLAIYSAKRRSRRLDQVSGWRKILARFR